MIETSLSRVKIHEVIESQIPESIGADNPVFGEFLKQYYISQEYQGGPVDIAENLNEYKSLDFLNSDNLTGFTSVSGYIPPITKTIYVDSTKGWPSSYGLLKIDNEIITYTGIGSTSFTGCVRGFSGIENNQKTNAPEYLTFTQSGVSTHADRSRVTNLSNLFLQKFFKKVKGQIAPGFVNRNFTGDLDSRLFLKQAQDFYSSKGTEEGFKILFGTLYNEAVDMVKPQEFLFKPSDAEYVVNDVLIAEVISGDPTKIKSQSISQGDYALASVYDVENIVIGDKQFYKIRLSSDTIEGEFKPTLRTKLTSPRAAGSSVLTVDSTIGFAKSSSLSIGNRVYGYTDKTLTEFLNVTGIGTVSIGTTVNQGDEIVSYEDGKLYRKVRLRVLNSIVGFEGSGVLQQKGSEYTIRSLGTTQKGIRYSEWLENIATKHVVKDFKTISAGNFELILTQPHYYKSGDLVEVISQDNQRNDGTITGILNDRVIYVNTPTLSAANSYSIQAKIKTQGGFVANIQNTYAQGDTVVVASNSLPHFNIDVQKRIRTFSTAGITTRSQLINIPDHNYQNGDIVLYNPVTSGSPVAGLSTGQSYYVTNLSTGNIYLSLSAENARRGEYVYVYDTSDIGTNTNHTLTPYEVGFGTIGAQKLIRKFETPIFGATKDKTETGTGVGLFVNGVEAYSYKSSDKVYYGSVEEIEVLNQGSDYDVVNPPRLSVQQDGHSGVGASVISQVTGTFKEILVNSTGLDYKGTPDVKITGGNGQATAQAKMKLAPHVVSFDSTSVGGIVNTSTDKFTFTEAHGFKHGEEIIYGTDGSTTIGIGTTPGNLINKSGYFVIKNDDYTISLAKTRNDALSGISTINITSNGGGLHNFETKVSRLKVDKVEIISSTNFHNRENTVDTVGINTFTSTFNIPNHRYSSGETIRYGGSDLTDVTGITAGNDYYVVKIDDHNFRVSISTSLIDYVDITDPGLGKHSFNYPPIVVTIDGSQGISTANATASPIIRGVIDGVHVKNKGDNFGSLIMNDNYRPDVVVIEGSKAAFDPVIVNGRIDSVSIKSGGKDFFSVPDMIVNGDGVGAKLIARVSNGKVVGVDVITKGAGYTENGTTITAKTPGSGTILSSHLRTWTINNVQRYANFGDVKDDDGFYGEFKKEENGYPYVNYYASRKLREFLDDDGSKHSPILGWAYDGHPIYGPYAIENRDGSGSLKYLESSYVKVSGGTRPNGPAFTDYGAGFFIEDYEYREGYGDLDEHNGRFAVTPEYPNGVYAYYVTESATVVGNPLSPFATRREPIFPYIVGDTYNSKLLPYNNDFTSTQDNLPDGLLRNTEKYNIKDYECISSSSKITSSIAQIKNTQKGSVDTLKIVEGGIDYAINDKLTFDNSDTLGFGASAKVTELVGVGATIVTSAQQIKEKIELFAEGTTVTGIVTSGLHDYEAGIPVQISGISSAIYSGLEGTFPIKVKFVRSGLGTSLLAGGLTTSITLRDNIDIFDVNDIVQVDDEQMVVMQHDHLNQKITLLRAQNGTTGAAHTDRAEIYRRENKFTYELDRPLDVATPKNVQYYFDATGNIGVGLTGGVGIGTTVSFVGAGNISTTTFLPIKAVRLPGHPFVHGDPLTYTPGGGSNLLYSYDSTNTHFLPTTGLFVQKISSDLIGIVTNSYQINNPNDRVFFNGTIGIGNSHQFRTNRNVPTSNATTFEVTVSTATTHHLSQFDEIDMKVVSAGSSTLNINYDSGTRFISIGSSNNPPITTTLGEKLIFDTSDTDLSGTKLEFFLDQEFTKKFVGSGKSTMERTDNLVPGITSARTTLHVTENVPDTLYYRFMSISPSVYVNIDEDVTDYGKIIVNPSEFTGKHSLTTATGTTFKFFTGGLPERVGYTSESSITYTTSSLSARGPISKVILEEGGVNYQDLPKVSVATTTGRSAVILAETESAGKLLTTEILEFGYDHSSDPTLSPEASVPNIITLKDNFSLDTIGITSTGSKYLSAPDLIVYNRQDDVVNSSVELVASLEGTSVQGVRVINSGGNLKSTDTEVFAINNSNGVGIISATYSDPTVTLRLQTPSGGFTTALPLPFTIGDEIFVENIGVSTGHGYNSSDFQYNYFVVSGVNTAPGLVDQATITYNVTTDPGTHDLQGFGVVTKKSDIAQFNLTLKEGVFFSGEEIYTDNATTNISRGQDSSTNIIRVDSLDGFNVGDLVRGKTSQASGVIESSTANTGRFKIGSTFKKSFGWQKDTGKTNEYFQRIQDNDYYQNFSYSLKSLVGISSWSEPVDSLAHPAGFKKHSDLLVPSVASVGIGSTVSAKQQQISSLVLIDNKAKVYCKHDFDLVRELTNAEQTKSDKVIFKSNKFGDALVCKTNRVLSIDDISPQFYSDPNIERAVELDSWGAIDFTAVKYYAQVVLDDTSGVNSNETHYSEFTVTHNGTTAMINQYSDLADSFDLGEFTANMTTGGQVSVSFEPYNSTFVYDVTVYREILNQGVGIGTTSYGNIKKVGVSSFVASSGSPSEQIIQSIDANAFKSGTVLVSVTGVGEKEVLEASFVGVGSTVQYIEYGKMIEDMDLGEFDIGMTGTNDLQIKFTPVAGMGVTVATLATLVGVGTTVSDGIPGGAYEVGDAYLESTRTEISASGTPAATNISSLSYNNYTSVKYYVEVENVTNNEYSTFHVAANAYQGDSNFVKYGNVSTGLTATRDIQNTDITVSGANVLLQFTPMENRTYVVRVSEIKIDKPDDVANDTTIEY
jgi:hypothetical protein